MGHCIQRRVKKQKKVYMVLSKAEIKKEFEAFIKRGISSDIRGYGNNHSYMIVEVFRIQREPSGLIGTSDVSLVEETIFPICKVLQVGVGFGGGYEVGDLVRMKDYDAMTISNPRYEAWVNNEYSKSNLKQIGGAPPAKLNNLWKNLGSRVFCLNPFSSGGDDVAIFYLDTPNVLMKVVDWEVWFGDIK